MPGQKSTVARHPERAQIERQLRAGTPATHVARDFDLSRQAVDRYKVKLMAKSAATGDGDRDAMRRQIQSLYNATVELVKTAKAANHPRAFLAATAEARKCLGLLSKILGLLNETPPPPVAVTVNVDIAELQQVILAALTPFPEARQAVASALIEHGDGEAGGDQ